MERALACDKEGTLRSGEMRHGSPSWSSVLAGPPAGGCRLLKVTLVSVSTSDPPCLEGRPQ